jgi:phosphatidylinositol glycan class B
MIFNNVRFSSENWSGSIFLIAYSLANSKQFSTRSFYLYVGLILGLSFLFRYQIGFLIAGFILWHLLVKKNYCGTFLMITGVILFIGVGILIDRWFYGKWTLTVWNYFNQNILLHKSLNFGISPWWYYIERIFVQAIPPFSIIYIVSFILVFIYKRNDLLTWTTLPFIIIHFILGHKEIRFLFPVIGFMPIIIIKSIEIIQSKWNKAILENAFIKISAKLFWIVNIIFLTIIAFTPADNQISLYHKLYSDYKGPATLYYIDANPYNRGLDIYFYKRADLKVIKIDSVNRIDLDVNRKILFVTKDKNILNDIKAHKRPIYSSYPGWIRVFNFNNWMARTNFWYVYELD